MISLNDIPRPKWMPRWLNIPLVIFTAFIVMLLFFGDNNFMRINDYKKRINNLKAEIKANNDSVRIYEVKVQELSTDRETLEKIAREQYGMRRANEEIYITDIK